MLTTWLINTISRWLIAGFQGVSALGTSPARTKTHQDLIDDTSRVTSQVSRKPDTLLPEMDRTVSERLPRMAAGNKKTTL